MLSRLLPILTLLLFAALAMASSIITPAFEFLDERDHYAYIRHLFIHRSLPVQSTDSADFQQFYQPPLYHAVGAVAAAFTPEELAQPIAYQPNVFFKAVYDVMNNDNKNLWLHTRDDDFPFEGTARAVHAARIASVLFGIVHGLVLIALGREIFRETELTAAFAALALLLPGYVSISGAISNDNAAALGGSLLLLFCWRLVDDPDRRRNWIGLAISISIATLSKVTTLFMSPAIALAMLIAWRRSKDRRALWVNTAMLAAIWLAATGWWFARNVALYGDLTAIKASRAQLGQGGEFSFARVWNALPFIWGTFVGRFANTTFPMPAFVYNVFALLIIVAIVGWGWSVLHRRPNNVGWLVILAAVAGIVGAVLYHAATNNTGAAGRLLYPALGGIAALIFGGLLQLLPERFHRAIGLAVWLGMVALSIIAVAVWTAQAHALPKQYDSFAPPPNFYALDYRYGDLITLRGYTLSADRIAPGGTLAATLYWETSSPLAVDYPMFLQIVDDRDNKIADRETYSGGGLFPTSRWAPNRVVADTVYLTIDPSAPAPQAYALIGGLWNLSTGERLPIRSDDPAAQLYKLGEVIVVPREIKAELPPSARVLSVEFASGIKLRGCAPSVGDSALTLFWQSTQTVGADYKIFVHLWDSAGNLAGGFDHAPSDGRFPTRYWQSGDWIEDKFALADPNVVARIDVGLYSNDTLQRLPMIEPPNPDGVFSLPVECWR